jgi:hypothetical protein
MTLLDRATPERLSALSDGVFAVLINCAGDGIASTGTRPNRPDQPKDVCLCTSLVPRPRYSGALRASEHGSVRGARFCYPSVRESGVTMFSSVARLFQSMASILILGLQDHCVHRSATGSPSKVSPHNLHTRPYNFHTPAGMGLLTERCARAAGVIREA